MADKKTAAFGIYPSVSQAERAVDALDPGATSRTTTSRCCCPTRQSSKNFAHEKNTKAPEGTATGVATGGTIGGTLGLLAGIGALAIPGVQAVHRGRSDHGCAGGASASAAPSAGWSAPKPHLPKTAEV